MNDSGMVVMLGIGGARHGAQFQLSDGIKRLIQ